MKLVATVAQMRECDRITIEEIGIPGIVLMETASRHVAAKAVSMLDGDVHGKKVICLCGKGNNGGDGLAVARHLAGRGGEVNVCLVGSPENLTGDALKNLEIYRRIDGEISVIENEEDVGRIVWDGDLIVDALLGTGFVPPVGKIPGKLIEAANNCHIPILAVDIPSGVSGDNGAVGAQAVSATKTVTFGLIKPGLVLAPGNEHCGNVEVVDIGIPPKVVGRQEITICLAESSDVSSKLRDLRKASHKGDAGYVFLLAGSPGLSGAAILSAEAAVRTGAGLVTVGVPKSLNSIFESSLIEAMSLPLRETEQGGISQEAWPAIESKIAWADAIAFGPGVGLNESTGKLLELILNNNDKPIVIDADGLSLLAANKELLTKLSGKTVLTPHPGEFSRLTGIPIAEIANDRINIVRQFAGQWGCVIHLKGAPSITVSPDGRVVINATGNPGMATGGSGDVLTGIIATLLAQGHSTFDASWSGSYLHGLSGDLARNHKGERSMAAGDLISYLPQALRTVIER